MLSIFSCDDSRRHLGSGWIPAFVGMTAFAGMTAAAGDDGCCGDDGFCGMTTKAMARHFSNHICDFAGGLTGYIIPRELFG